VTRPTERGDDRALHGLTRTLIANMVEGVTKGFEKRLELQGVGYRAALQGADLRLDVGYSHPVVIKARQGITFEVPDRPRSSSRASTSSRSARPRRDPQGAPARAVQGQGHPLSGRVRPPEGRQARLMADSAPVSSARAAPAPAVCAARSPARPSGPRLRRHALEPRHRRAQLVDDSNGRTLASGRRWLQVKKSFKGDKTAQAAEVGKLLARSAKEAKIDSRGVRPRRATSTTGA
jgi:hypothetical protein